jgi:hypothetical protein
MKHIEKGEAKGDAHFEVMKDKSASFTIISRADGCESQGAKYFAARALKNRNEKMIAALKAGVAQFHK